MQAHLDPLSPPEPSQRADASASVAAAASATICERCGGAFHCGVQDPTPCACTGVQLDATQRSALRQRYQHCLCVRCLAAIAAGASPDPLP